jgi:hypothetical protein
MASSRAFWDGVREASNRTSSLVSEPTAPDSAALTPDECVTLAGYGCLRFWGPRLDSAVVSFQVGRQSSERET